MFSRGTARRWIAGCGGVAALIAAPALADVKAGVDAWARGDYPAAVREWQAAADKGDADGEFNLAQAYKLGRGVPQDLGKAEALYGKAAAQGHVQAADNYGLLLFQRGEHEKAMPYVKAGADHGDPRAQYLLGIAMFNGDGMAKDWVRAYALVSLAQQQGLPQAQPALTQMDQYIPLEQRQRAVAVATEMAAQAEANRQRQFAAMDLGGKPAPVAPSMPHGTAMATGNAAPPPRPLPPATTADGRPIDRGRLIASGTPLARPAARPEPVAEDAAPTPKVPAKMPAKAPAPPARAVRPAMTASASPSPSPAPAPTPVTHAAGGNWRIQLGAFGVAANADAMWAKARALPEVAGHPRHDVKAGAVTRVLAGGFSEEAARAACRKLTARGVACIPVGD